MSNTYPMRVVGLMSGTSADAIDAVLAEIEEIDGQVHVRQQAFVTEAWRADERALIFDLFEQRATVQTICRANFALGEGFARAALAVIAAARLSPADVDLIGSHGQTIWHDVNAQGQVTSTLQIGEPAVIAERTGVTTVADFRVADVAAGGQGAPLVPIFDWLLLRPGEKSGGWRAVQNIGGIGNVTLLPPNGEDVDPLAFDTGPGNVLIDWAAQLVSGGELRCDVDGQLAAAGTVASVLLESWLDHPYFRQTPPKSTGRELFTRALAEDWLSAARAHGCSDADFVATVTELTAASIADAYVRFAPGRVVETVVGGGGGRNPVLMARLAAQLEAQLGRPVPVLRHADLPHLALDDDAKEALAFALMAWLTVHGRAANVPACTGAQGQRVLGKIVMGNKQLWTRIERNTDFSL
ncbi:MAG: anhydro-N-acetylmuramic acid kinase [Caldilineaceae bacterium]